MIHAFSLSRTNKSYVPQSQARIQEQEPVSPGWEQEKRVKQARQREKSFRLQAETVCPCP